MNLNHWEEIYCRSVYSLYCISDYYKFGKDDKSISQFFDMDIKYFQSKITLFAFSFQIMIEKTLLVKQLFLFFRPWNGS